MEFNVPDECAGMALRDYLRYTLSLSAGLVKRAKYRDGGICIDGREVHTNYILVGGEVLTLTTESDGEFSSGVEAVEGTLDTVYEDEEILIINKAGGMPVHPSQNHHTDSVANVVAYKYKNMIFRPVNRLDKGTSGLMVIAKNADICARLCSQLHTTFKKEYLGVCDGVFDEKSGVINAPIGRADGSVIKREVRPDGKCARTFYSVENETLLHSLVRFKITTGRTHQIRVHASHIGHPITNDFLYGNEDTSLISRPALHACRIEFDYRGKAVSFDAPLPDDMKGLIL